MMGSHGEGKNIQFYPALGLDIHIFIPLNLNIFPVSMILPWLIKKRTKKKQVDRAVKMCLYIYRTEMNNITINYCENHSKKYTTLNIQKKKKIPYLIFLAWAGHTEDFQLFLQWCRPVVTVSFWHNYTGAFEPLRRMHLAPWDFHQRGGPSSLWTTGSQQQLSLHARCTARLLFSFTPSLGEPSQDAFVKC